MHPLRRALDVAHDLAERGGNHVGEVVSGFVQATGILGTVALSGAAYWASGQVMGLEDPLQGSGLDRMYLSIFIAVSGLVGAAAALQMMTRALRWLLAQVSPAPACSPRDAYWKR